MAEVFFSFKHPSCSICKNRNDVPYVGHVYLCKDRIVDILLLADKSKDINDLWDVGELASISFNLFDEGPGNPTVVAVPKLEHNYYTKDLLMYIKASHLKENSTEMGDRYIEQIQKARSNNSPNTGSHMAFSKLHVTFKGIWWETFLLDTKCHVIISEFLSTEFLRKIL